MGFETKTGLSINQTWQQWISFSLNSWNTINYDLNSFENMPEEQNLGLFLNKIIVNYADLAQCSFAEHKSKYLQIINEYNENLDDENKERLLNCLIKATKKAKVSSTYEKKRFYLEMQTKQLLCDSENDMYYDSIKEYLEAIIEEYISLPYYERERIYFRDQYEKIQKALSEHVYLKISIGNKDLKIRPLMIETDKSANYNYLICTEAPQGIDHLISLRLHHIKLIYKTRDKFKALNKEETKKLRSLVDKYSAPYLKGISDPMIKVHLTKSGMENYKAWINQRPPYTGEPDILEYENETYFVLTFNCSKRQVQNYFFKFGADAMITEPEDLRDLFSKMYDKASDIYKSMKEEN
ncbi:MAG: WYL domain-containing protein [Ruminococcus sp.]|nr:WYL domain-containing protein [Ruminococcus sp.]